jgi:hypothetical protein
MMQRPMIHFDPRLMEEAVFHAQRDFYVSRELDNARSRIYEIPEADERENRFNELNRSWFARLGLGNAIEQALQEQSLVMARVEACVIAYAAQAKEEGAELFVAADKSVAGHARRTLRVLLRPESLLNANSLLTFLRHELFHIADMLDPAFGYEPILPKTEGGPTYDTLITNRYRVLWDVTINGRMMRRGWLTASAREQQLNEFLHAFPMLAAQTEELFNRFYDTDEPKHAELTRFALDPRAAGGNLTQRSAPATHCPLCKFPTHSYEPAPENLGDEILTAIREDFPQWEPSQGLCTQCAELYRGRSLSLAALRLVPGWSSHAERDELGIETRNTRP